MGCLFCLSLGFLSEGTFPGKDGSERRGMRSSFLLISSGPQRDNYSRLEMDCLNVSQISEVNRSGNDLRKNTARY